jgi:hypothetical protein
MTENDPSQEQDRPQEWQEAQSPGPGHPAGETTPYGAEGADMTHPEDIADTKPDEEAAEDVTESPGSPSDPESG